MPSFEDLSKKFADDIRAALREDGFPRIAAVTEQMVRGSRTASALREIARSLDEDWKVDDRPLTEDQKRIIIEGAARELGLRKPENLSGGVKSASNDEFMELTDYIDNELKTGGGS